MPYCTKCGKSVAQSDIFCSKCGNRLPSQASSMESPVVSQSTTHPISKNHAPLPAVQPSGIRKCKGCGKIINQEDNYCSKCLVLTEELPSNEIPPNQIPPPPRQVFR